MKNLIIVFLQLLLIVVAVGCKSNSTKTNEQVDTAYASPVQPSTSSMSDTHNEGDTSPSISDSMVNKPVR